VVTLKPAGFVVIAADDELEPVLAFALKGQFVGKAGNPLFDMLLKDTETRIHRARLDIAAKRQPSAERTRAKAKWAMLTAGLTPEVTAGPPSPITTVDDECVAPLVQTEWSQSTTDYGTPMYNYYTPGPNFFASPGSANNYVCGCVATAMAQVMRYWQWPQGPVGTASFPVTVDGAPANQALRGGNGAGGAYDWADMVLVPGSSVTAQQCQAIGALTADAAASVNMEYDMGGSDESGANPSAAVMRDVFNYANAASIDSGSITQYLAAIRPNLDAGQPVMLSISGPAGGHEVVCDGYGYTTGTIYHHLNVGWGPYWAGLDDVWYNLPEIDPPESGYTFDSVDAVYYNMNPTTTGEIISGRVTQADGTPVSGVLVTLTGATVRTGTTNAEGIYVFTGVPSNTSWTVLPSGGGAWAYSPAQQMVTMGQSNDYGPTGDQIADFSATPRGAGPFTLTPSAGANGTISPNTTEVVSSGSNVTFTATPAAGYQVNQWLVNGTVQQTGGTSFTLYNVASSGPVQVTFTPMAPVQPQMLSPAPGSTFTSSTETFQWNPGFGNSEFLLYVGSTPGGVDLYISGSLGATTTSANVTGIPVDGRTIYVQLWSYNATTGYQYTNYTYTAADTALLSVTISPAGAVSAGAQWNVDGGAWQSSGTILSGLAPGNHTVNFSTVAGYTSPGSQNVTTTIGTTTAITAVYVPPTGSLCVTLSPPGAAAAGAQWQVGSGPMQNSGATVSGLAIGNQHIVTFTTPGGFYTPNPNFLQVNINAGQTTTATITYPAMTEALSVSIYPAGAVSAGAQWNLDGGAWQSNNATLNGLTLGNHTIYFSAIAGYGTPPSQSITMTANETSYQMGNYTAYTPSSVGITVAIAPAGAVNAGAQWNLDGGAWQSNGGWVGNIAVGSHTINFSTVAGYVTPASQSVIVSGTQATMATGTYSVETGALAVTITPAGAVNAGAQWNVDGGAWQSSGAAVSGLALGSHTVNFSAVSGYTAPASQTITVNANQTTAATASYVAQTGGLSVTISPAGAVSGGAQWNVDGGGGQSSGAAVSGLAVGSHTVNFSAVSGYTTPASQTITVNANQTTAATAIYVSQAGGLSVTISPPGAVSAGAEWSVDWGAWQSSGATVSGLAPGPHTVNFNTVAGYTAPAAENITVNASQTTAVPAIYVAQTGGLSVTIMPAGAASDGAQWNVDGGVWQSSGATVSGLVPGSHTVNFSALAGYAAPVSENVAVNAGQTTAATGSYTLENGALSVTITPAGAVSDGAQWNVDGGAWQSSGAAVSGLSLGSHTVNFSAVTGYTTPAAQNVTVALGLPTEVSGSYTGIPVMSLEEPVGSPLASGSSTVDFETGFIHGNDTLQFAIHNHGVSTLTVKGVTISGSNASDFSAALFPILIVAPGQSVPFGVTFNPAALGSCNATLGITTNDPVTPSFIVALTGSGISTGQLAGVYAGLVDNNAGALSLTVNKKGLFTGKLMLSGSAFGLHGSFNGSGNYTASLGAARVPVVLHLGWNQVNGTAAGIPVTAWRSAFSAGETITEAGAYTALLSVAESGTAAPGGTGYSTMSVSKTGNVALRGKLSDGTAFSTSAVIVAGSCGDEISVYLPKLTTGGEMLAGAIAFEKLAESNCDGALEWYKPKQTGTSGYYPAGFDATLDFDGSTYKAPAHGSAVLPFANGTVQLSGGGIVNPITDAVSLMATGGIAVSDANPDAVKLSVTAATGMLGGSFVHPATGKTVKFGGVLYQDPANPCGGGYFLMPVSTGTAASGSVTIVPGQ
jgi:hypothetical protein